MTQPATTPLPPVAEFARASRDHVPAVAAAVAQHIVESVGRYNDEGGQGRELVTEALTAAMHEFLDLFDGLPHRDRAVGKLFRTLGQRHAARHDDVSSLYAALLVAGTTLPSTLTSVGGPAADDPLVMGRLSAAGHHYLARLTGEITTGFKAARRHLDHELGRRKLAEQLLAGRWDRATAEPDSRGSAWPVPEQLVVLVAEKRDGSPVPAPVGEPPGLAVRRGPRLIAIADVQEADAAARWLAADPDVRVAVSWSVEPEGAGAALRWAGRAHTLARHGVVPDAPLIDCAAHRTQIWLHAEPRLRQQLCQDLLAPLLAETPNSREILSETLLYWLESRDSAPAIAARLGVHPQTVRYRWKRINEIFGEDLHDPEFVVQVTMLLKASVPLWKAGDQSDFERFKAEEAS